MGFDITLETNKLPKPDIKSKASNLSRAVDNEIKSDGKNFGASVADTISQEIEQETDVPANVKRTTSMDKAAMKAPQTPPNRQPQENYKSNFNSMPKVGNPSTSFGESDDVTSGMETDESEKDLAATWEKSKAKNKTVVEAAIDKSPNVVAALEAVADIYKVPPSHILADNSLRKIKVQEDFIIAPENTNVQGNKENIIRAIATLLDNIGCRIDKQFDDYQNSCIAQNKEIERQQMLSAQGRPSFDDTASKVYFNDQDDITADVKPQPFGDDSSEPQDVPEPKAFGDEDEDSSVMEYLYDLYGTPYIGSTMFSEMGYDVDKYSSEFIQEAKTNGSSTINPEDIKYMRFDNSGIVKAIKCFNEVRAEQSDVKEDGALSYQKIIKNPKFKEGVDALAEQFDCRIRLTLEDTNDVIGYTMVDRMVNPRHKVTISKKSGFKLNGFTIYICISTGLLQFASPKEEKNFGQMLTSVLLHEIFHNITTLLAWNNMAWIGAYSATITRAIQANSPKVKKVLIDKYITYLEETGGKMDKLKKFALKKQLFALCSSKQIQSAFVKAKQIKKTADDSQTFSGNGATGKTADENATILIDKLNEVIPQLKDQYKTKPGHIASAIVSWCFTALLTAGAAMGYAASGPLGVFAVVSGFVALIKTGIAAYPAMLRKMAQQFKSGKDLEEQFADAFAAMYKLPVVFHFIPSEDHQTKFKYNEMSSTNLDQLVKLFKEYGTLIMDVHPTDYQRASQAIKAAKQILADGGKFIDPTQKRYLEWLVNGFDSIEDTSVDDVVPGESPVFDPNATADLNKHLENLIQHGRKNINITESFNFNDLMDRRDVVMEQNVPVDFWDNSSTYGQKFIGNPVSDDDITSAENELGVQLPAAYKELIKQQNGGMVNRCIFPCGYKTGWSDDHIEITNILGIDKNKPSIFGTGYLQSEWGYPEGYLNIANTPVSGHLEVFLDYREAGPNTDPPVVSIDQEDNYKVTLLAESFGDFIRNLITKDEFENLVRHGRKNISESERPRDVAIIDGKAAVFDPDAEEKTWSNP